MRRLTSGYTVASLPPRFLFLVIKGHPCAPLTVSRRYFHATPWSTRLSYRHIEDTLRGPPPPSADLLGLAASVTVCDCDLWVTHSGYISVQVIYIMYGKTVRETERTLTVLFNRQCSLLNGKEGIYFFADDGRCYVLCTAQVA